MSLNETIKDLKKQIEEQEKLETQEVEKEEEEVVEEQEDATEEKPKEETKEEVKEEPKEEPKEEVKEDTSNAAMARMRREAAAAKKKAEEAEAKRLEVEAKLAALQTPEIKEETAEVPLNQELEEVIEDRRYKRAEREFQALEEKFKSTVPDYENVSAEYALALAQSIRIQNPRLSAIEIAEKTKKELLLKASAYVRDGFNPIEELYHEAKDLGFTGKSFEKKPEVTEEVKEEPRPDMKKVAQNRAKSTGMASSTGKSVGQLTKAAAATELTNEEWARLPQDEKRRLLYG